MAKELGRKLSLQEVAHSISRNFGTVFGSQMLWLENLDALLQQSVGVPLKRPEELRQIHKEEDIFRAVARVVPGTRQKQPLRVSMDEASAHGQEAKSHNVTAQVRTRIPPIRTSAPIPSPTIAWKSRLRRPPGP